MINQFKKLITNLFLQQSMAQTIDITNINKKSISYQFFYLFMQKSKFFIKHLFQNQTLLLQGQNIINIIAFTLPSKEILQVESENVNNEDSEQIRKYLMKQQLNTLDLGIKQKLSSLKKYKSSLEY
ncbi:hypothetical protein ABPG72_002608 [Tetrahymena utriculariae]